VIESSKAFPLIGSEALLGPSRGAIQEQKSCQGHPLCCAVRYVCTLLFPVLNLSCCGILQIWLLLSFASAFASRSRHLADISYRRAVDLRKGQLDRFPLAGHQGVSTPCSILRHCCFVLLMCLLHTYRNVLTSSGVLPTEYIYSNSGPPEDLITSTHLHWMENVAMPGRERL